MLIQSDWLPSGWVVTPECSGGCIHKERRTHEDSEKVTSASLREMAGEAKPASTLLVGLQVSVL